MPAKRMRKQDTETEYIGIGHLAFDIAGAVMMSLIVVIIFMAFFVRQVTVDGNSMNDTLLHDDRLLVSCFNYTPKCGDIVIVTHGADLDELIVKRVIATEGQSLDIYDDTGEVVVDGVLLKEPYIVGVTHSLHDNAVSLPMVIPEGYVFVMGDNRQHSLDSRSARVGLIPVENIVGKAIFRWYPMDALGSL